MKYLLIALVAMVLTSCAMQSHKNFVIHPIGHAYQSNEYDITVIENKSTVEFTYNSRPYIEWKTKKEAKQKLLSQEETNAEISKIPKYGYLQFVVHSTTIGSANPEYWEFVIMDLEDNVIARQKGARSVPNHMRDYYGTDWYAYEFIGLYDDKVKPPLKIAVIDIQNKRSIFKVSKR